MPRLPMRMNAKHGRSVFFVAALTILALLPVAAGAQAPVSLESLAGWNAPGLGGLQVSGVKKDALSFSGTLPPVAGGRVKPRVFGFKSVAQKTFNIGLVIDGFHLGDFSNAVHGTPLDNLMFQSMTLLSVPQQNAGQQVAIPSALQGILGKAPLKLPKGVQIDAKAKLIGAAAKLLGAFGLRADVTKVGGSLDPSIFSGGLNSAAAKKAFLDQLDLTLPLPALNPKWRPGFIGFGASSISIKGTDGAVAMGLETSMTLAAGQSLTFDPVTATYDAAKNVLALDGKPAKSSPPLKLPLSGAAPSDLAFSGRLDTKTSTYAITGKVNFGGKVHDFEATLTGKQQASYAITLKGAFSLADLGLPGVPGLDHITLNDPTLSPGLFSGTAKIGHATAKVVAFKPAGREKYTVAVLHDSLALSDYVSAVRGTPLDDLRLTKTAFLIVPKENAGISMALPGLVAGYAGATALTLPAGVNIQAVTQVIGTAGTLLRSLRLPTKGLPLGGAFDPSIFASPSSLGQTFLANLDLKIPLGALSIPGMPRALQLSEAVLRIKGAKDGIDGTLTSPARLTFSGKTFPFDQATIAISQHGGAKTYEIAATSTATWPRALGIASMDLRDIGFDVKFGAVKQLALTSIVDLGAKKNLGVRVNAVAGKGGAVDYSIALKGSFKPTDIGLPAIPGFDSLTLTDPTLSPGYFEGGIKIANVGATLVAFTPPGRRQPVVALLHDELALSTYVPAVRGTPLDDLRLAKTAFLIAPTADAGHIASLPASVAGYVGATNITLKPGVNIKAITAVVGKTAELLTQFRLPTQGLPLSGGFDRSIFQRSSSLAKEFLANLDLSIPIGAINISGLPGHVQLAEASLHLKGFEDGIRAQLTSSARVTNDGKVFNFTEALIGVTDKAGAKTVEIAATSTASWARPLGIHWLTVRDLGFDVKMGAEKELALTGVTTLGDIKDLTVKVDVSASGGSVGGGIELLGADIPLSDLPGLNRLPNASKFALRDVVLSTNEIAGTSVTKDIKALNGLRTVVFKVDGGWNLAMFRDTLKLTDLVKLQGPAAAALKNVALAEAAIVLSGDKIDAAVTDLPPAARSAMEKIYGASTGHLHLAGGLNMVTAIDPAVFGAGLAALSGQAGKPIAFSGGFGGLFGGPPSLNIAADIPNISMPPALKFLQLPRNFQSSLFISVEPDKTDFGVQIATEVDIHTKHRVIPFDLTIDFEADSTGGLAIDLQGKTDKAWPDALGIKGFTLDPGTRMEIKASVTSEIDITFVGKSHIGTREVDVTAAVGVIDGVIDKGAFEGKLSELDFSDFVIMANNVARATGGKPTDPKKAAKVKFTGLDLAIASPGVDVPEMKLVGGGMRFAGDVWYLYKDSALGSFSAQIDATGLAVAGKLHDFKAGPVAMKNTSLDAGFKFHPPELPHFDIKGDINLFKAELAGELGVSPNGMLFHTLFDDGPLIKFDLKAQVITPKLSFSPAELAKFDMSVRAELQSDIPKWLRTDGKKFVASAFNGMTRDLQAMIDAVDAAQKKVDDLDKTIANARAQVKRERASAANALNAAQRKVDGLNSTINSLDRGISSDRSHIHTCNYKKRICTWYDVIKRKCTSHKSVWDPGRNASCAKTNITYGARVAAKETSKKAAQVSLAAAEKLLEGIKKGEQTDTTDLDPRVAVPLGERATATAALNLAKEAAKGAKAATQQVKAALDIFAKYNLFVLKEGLIQGSLHNLATGIPAVAAVTYEIAGKSHTAGLAFSATDPGFTGAQFEGIALFVAMKIVEGLGDGKGSNAALLQLLHGAYEKKHDQVEAERQKALKANGLG